VVHIFKTEHVQLQSKIGVEKIIYIIIKISNIGDKFCSILKIIITNLISYCKFWMLQLQSFTVICKWQQLSCGNSSLLFLIIIGLYAVVHNSKVYSCITNYCLNIASFYLIFSTLCDLCMLPVIESLDELRFSYISKCSNMIPQENFSPTFSEWI